MIGRKYVVNKQRRNNLSIIKEKINSIRCSLETIKDDEELSFDNMPENLQGSSKGEESEEAIELLEETIEYIEKAIEQLDLII